jgi:hypothetical protein
VSENAHQVALLQLSAGGIAINYLGCTDQQRNSREDESFFRNKARCNAEKESERTPLEQ